jgi:hypothetical protein
LQEQRKILFLSIHLFDVVSLLPASFAKWLDFIRRNLPEPQYLPLMYFSYFTSILSQHLLPETLQPGYT